jgi:hypothetical protein
MVRIAPQNDHTSSELGYRVELPRQCDSIGAVLRGAFDREMGLPDDMLMMLRQISGRPATSRDG